MSEGRYSVAFPRDWWYPACRSRDLGRKPHGISLMETPLVLFRDAGGAARALIDRCPHRNYPLSLGRLTPDGTLECGYHGWRFDGCGDCVAVPGLAGGDTARAETRSVATYPTAERDGFVWIWGDPSTEPTRPPFSIPQVGPRVGNGEVVFSYDLDTTMHAAIENALDVPHTAFLHRGLFRGSSVREITAVRRPLEDGVEVQYLGEPVGFGPVQFRNTDKTFDHWDRFLLPCVAQVEYHVEGWAHIVNTILHLPLAPFRTRAWFVVRWWSRLPARLVKPVVLLQGRQILKQDAKALAAQTEGIRRFGGERYASSELDLIGNAVWRLLRHAERGEALDGETAERTVTFTV